MMFFIICVVDMEVNNNANSESALKRLIEKMF